MKIQKNFINGAAIVLLIALFVGLNSANLRSGSANLFAAQGGTPLVGNVKAYLVDLVDSTVTVRKSGIEGNVRGAAVVEEVTHVSGGDEIIKYDVTTTEGRTKVNLHAGHQEHTNLLLKGKLSKESSLYKWFREIKRGNNVRKNIKVRAVDSEGNEVRHRVYYNAVPVRWGGTSSDNPEVVEVEIAFEKTETVERFTKGAFRDQDFRINR